MEASVYLHTSPNGKVYVGIAENPLKRWADGSGYKTNALFFADIELYGWENFKHEIIATYETRTEAERLEERLILILDSENPEKGYNQTHIKADTLRILAGRKNHEKPQQTTTPSPFTAENAVKDYLQLAQLPQFDEIRQALTHIAKLPQNAAPIELDGWGKFYEIPKDIYEILTEHNNRRVYSFSPTKLYNIGRAYIEKDEQSIKKCNLFSGGMELSSETETRYFMDCYGTQCAEEMLYNFSVCREVLGDTERGETT